MKKILLDTNIIIDFASKRTDFFDGAKQILMSAMQQKYRAYLTATTITDIFYILKKENGREHTILFLKEILHFIDILDVDKEIVIAALYSEWNDFEDAVQAQTAIENSVDAVITRNTKDYSKLAGIKVLSPAEFIKQML